MRDEHGNRVELGDQASRFVPQLASQRLVEVCVGLVEQQHPRVRRQRTCQRNALALTARQLVRVTLFETRKLGQLDQLGSSCRRRLAAQPEPDIPFDRQVREQRTLLEDETHGALLGRQLQPGRRYEPVIDVNLPLLHRQQTRRQPEQRALATTGRPDHAGDRAG